MLWTNKYYPIDFNSILGQDHVIRLLSSFAASKTIPHLIFTGPHGTGKSAAIQCFALALYGPDWELNTSVFQTADLFLQGKSFLEQEERYAHLYQKNLSLISNFKHIIKWYASLRPLNAEFKLMVFEDAHALTLEAQQALRRTMEQASLTCRFIFSTTNQSEIIPPITSRCLPLFFTPVEQTLMLDYLKKIRNKEGGLNHDCNDDELELIVHAARGDMRQAILLLQVALETGRCRELFTVAQSETANIAASALTVLREGDNKNAIRRLESLMIDYGLSGSEVFSEIRTLINREYNHPALAIALANAEHRMLHCNNEYVQIGAFATGIRGVLK
jgi:replication factor C small subunit